MWALILIKGAIISHFSSVHGTTHSKKCIEISVFQGKKFVSRNKNRPQNFELEFF